MISVCVLISFEIMVPTSTDLELFAKDTKFAIEQKQKDYFNFGSYFTFAGETLELGKFLNYLSLVHTYT